MGKSLKRNEDGMAMVLVIMAMLVFSLLGMASLSMASSNVNNSLDEREFQSAFYVAEAGVNYHTEVIKKNIKAAYDSTNTADEFFHALENNLTNNKTYTTDLFHAQEGYIPEAKVELKRLDIDNPRTYAVVSHGITDNATRTVAREIVIKWSPGFDASSAHALYSREQMHLNGIVHGTVGSSYKEGVPNNQDSDDPPIVVGWSARFEDYYIPSSGDDIRVEEWYNEEYYGERKSLPADIEYDLPEFPTFPEVDEDDDKGPIKLLNSTQIMGISLDNPITYISEIELGSSSMLTIDLKGEDRILIVDNIDINQGFVFLENGGSLKLYVTGDMTFGGAGVLNHPNPQPGYKDGHVTNELNESSAKDATEEQMVQAASKLSIFIKGTSDESTNKQLNLTNNITLCGSVYGQDMNVLISNSVKIAGNIVTGGNEVESNGDCSVATSMIYAPLAHVKILASAKIKGPIISNTLKYDGGSLGYVSFDPDEDNIIDNDIFPKEAKIISEGSVLEQ
jgi:Tfp pilus assembly protein PilX